MNQNKGITDDCQWHREHECNVREVVVPCGVGPKIRRNPASESSKERYIHGQNSDTRDDAPVVCTNGKSADYCDKACAGQSKESIVGCVLHCLTSVRFLSTFRAQCRKTPSIIAPNP